MRTILLPALLLAALLRATSPTLAGEADVLSVEPVAEPGGTWRFAVTVRHADQGWDHFADRWQVLAPDGAVLGERELLHPHDNEQPFTRSLSGVVVPDGVTEVTVRAHDKVHGWSGAGMIVPLPR